MRFNAAQRPQSRYNAGAVSYRLFHSSRYAHRFCNFSDIRHHRHWQPLPCESWHAASCLCVFFGTRCGSGPPRDSPCLLPPVGATPRVRAVFTDPAQPRRVGFSFFITDAWLSKSTLQRGSGPAGGAICAKFASDRHGRFRWSQGLSCHPFTTCSALRGGRPVTHLRSICPNCVVIRPPGASVLQHRDLRHVP